MITCQSAAEERLANAPRVRILSQLPLQAQEERGNARNDGRGKAGTAPAYGAAIRAGAQNLFAGSQDSLRLVRGAPVAQVEWFSPCIHSSHCQDGIQRRRDVHTVTAIVPGGRDDEGAALDASANRLRQYRVSGASGHEFAAADVDHVSAELNGLEDRSGKIQVRARLQIPRRVGLEDWQEKPATGRCDAPNRAVMLTEQNAGNMSAMCQCQTRPGRAAHQRFELGQASI
jgi:hypothetical protein